MTHDVLAAIRLGRWPLFSRAALAPGYMLAPEAATLRSMGGQASCPICGRDVSTSADNKARPFCSPNCKLIDLDRWLSGSYRVPGPPVESSGMGEYEGAEPKGDDEP